MQKQKIMLIAGVVLAMMAVFMTKAYIDQERQKALNDAKKKIANMQANIPKSQVQVLVASKDIPKGSVISEGSIEVSVIPEQYRQPQAVSSVERILGMITVVQMEKGEQVTLTKLAQAKQAGGLAEGTPIGKRAVTVSMDTISALAGMIKPGDYVDVMAMVPIPVQTADFKQATQIAVMPLFQNVLVLAVGKEIGAPSKSAGSSGRYSQEETKKDSGSAPLITLALGPQEANLIAFVQEQGKIRLTLRSPADSRIESTQPASWDTLFRYIMPQQESTSKPEIKELPKEMTTATEYIDIYRGLNKEKIPLSKK